MREDNDSPAASESRRDLFRRFAQDTPSAPPVIDELPPDAIGHRLRELGISRRGFMQFCAGMASLMALPPSMVPAMAAALLAAKPSVIYMSFQECTGCLESLVNSGVGKSKPGSTIENLILNLVSLDYQETLMAAAGAQAESLRESLMKTPGYVLVVDGSIPADPNSGYFVSGGESGVARFKKAARNAGLIISVGTCASFGGLPAAVDITNQSPTGALSIDELLSDIRAADPTFPKATPLINVSGCPPIAEVMTGVIVYYLTQKKVPELDSLKRPKMFYGETIHDECYREEFFERGLFAESFDDAGARKGYCLLHLGCKGPVTHNACSKVKWNQGTSFPMQSGHGCIGCSEPDFWDRKVGGQKGFYLPLPRGSFDD
jgi:hydrogenase small subunit